MAPHLLNLWRAGDPMKRHFLKLKSEIIFSALLITGVLLASPFFTQAAESTPPIHVLNINGVINPLSARYLKREIAKANRGKAQAILLELNTPGGLESSMREMVQEMQKSSLPVIVYVTPQGESDASAGVFITLAGHVAAMAPGTNIGAAPPVSLNDKDPKKAKDPMKKKWNGATSLASAIAKERGRESEWTEKAARKNLSITAEEALSKDVIDFIATDRYELLHKLNGKSIVIQSSAVKKAVVLQTGDVRLVEKPMHLHEKILQAITDPIAAYLLITVGVIGIMAELYRPGVFFPGMVGLVSLITGFTALGSFAIE